MFTTALRYSGELMWSVPRCVKLLALKKSGVIVVSSAARYFLDSNVFLRLGDPDTGFLSRASEDFLQAHEGELVVGSLVITEVMYQLRTFPGSFRRIKDIKRWLFQGCTELENDAVVPLIDSLQRDYAADGWHGNRGDSNDRVHVATASAFRIPYLVTWEDRICRQQEWVRRVNAQHGLVGVQLIRPDAYLSV
jgi:predicted nucleic acid-binding protein